MRRAIPILAAALLVGSGAGCVTRHCDFGTLTIYWTFTDAAGVTRGCDGSGVSTVRVTIDGAAYDFACAGDGFEGATFTDIITSTYPVQVEGLDANLQQLYLFQDNVGTNGCADATVRAGLSAVQGTLQINYAINAGACPEGSFIWYSLFDVTGNQLYSAVDDFTIACNDSAPALLFNEVPFGQYQLDFIQTVVPPGHAIDGNCNRLTFDHFSNDAINVTLYEIGVSGGPSNCPVGR